MVIIYIYKTKFKHKVGGVGNRSGGPPLYDNWGPPTVIKDFTPRSLRTLRSVRGTGTSPKEPKTKPGILYVLGPSKLRGPGAAGSDLASSRALFKIVLLRRL